MNYILFLLFNTLSATDTILKYNKEKDSLLSLNISSKAHLHNDLYVKFTIEDVNYIIYNGYEDINNCIFSRFYVPEGPILFFRLCHDFTKNNKTNIIEIGKLSYSFSLINKNQNYISNVIWNKSNLPFDLNLKETENWNNNKTFPKIQITENNSGIITIYYKCAISKCNTRFVCNKLDFELEKCNIKNNIDEYIEFIIVFGIMLFISTFFICIVNIFVIYEIRFYLYRILCNR
jgi:hypothetical protein